MKPLSIFLSSLFLLLIASCSTSNSGSSPEIIEVSLGDSELYEYETGIKGDGQRATIVDQATHYEISRVVKDASTGWEAVYRYKPTAGFDGNDSVQLKLSKGTKGASDKAEFKFVLIKFSINE